MANASLGGVTLDENPRVYTNSLPERRHSVHRTYIGGTVIQNFGVRVRDTILVAELSYVTGATRTLLEAVHSGAQPVTWVDPAGASMSVVVLSMTFDRWRGHDLYRGVIRMQRVT